MKKSVIALVAPLFFGVALLSSCQKENLGAEQAKPSKGEASEGEARKVGGVVQVDLSADYEMSDDLRGLQMKLIDRENTGTPDYSNESRPTVEFDSGTTIPVFVTIVKVDGTGKAIPNSIHTQILNFKITERGTAADGGRRLIDYQGYMSLPVGYTTLGTSADKWYIMGMLNASASLGSSPKYSVSSPFFTRAGGGYTSFGGVPFGSNWVPLDVITSGGSVLGRTSDQGSTTHNPNDSKRMLFRPLGVMLQVDEGLNFADASDLKGNTIVSNVLDFSGAFDFSPAAVQAAFDARNTTDGTEGIPAFVPKPSDTSANTNFRLYDWTGANPLASSNGYTGRDFPWDMPALENITPSLISGGTIIPTRNTGYSTLSDVSFGSDMSLAEHWYSIDTYASPSGTKWSSSQEGIVDGVNTWVDRKYFLFWGMPKKVAPAKPYTYIYQNIYTYANNFGAMFPGIGTFNPRTQVYDKENQLSSYRYSRDLAKQQVDEYDAILAYMNSAGQSGTPTYTDIQNKRTTANNTYTWYKNQYDTLLDNMKNDAALFYGSYEGATVTYNNPYQSQYRWYQSEGAQPYVPVYQTGSSFRGASGKPMSGKVVHAQTIVFSELMITEVVHKEDNGQNYSVLELYNPGRALLDLSPYAIVRLRPNAAGNGFGFRKKDGTVTDNLADAQILPLAALNTADADPFATSGFSAFKANSTVGGSNTATRRQLVDGLGESGYYVTLSNSGQYGGTQISYQKLLNNGKMYLPSRRTIIVGASGYVNSPVTWGGGGWFGDWAGYLHYKYDGAYNLQELSYFYGYADGAGSAKPYSEGTMDMQVGDAFALIKKTHNGWQIVDATGPIGSEGYAFAGTYADHQAKTSGLTAADSYSMRRDGKVQFPFIFPYRTARLYPSDWSDDWDFYLNNQSVYDNLGSRISQRKPGFWGSYWFLKRTPYDASYTTYRANRPVR